MRGQVIGMVEGAFSSTKVAPIVADITENKRSVQRWS